MIRRLYDWTLNLAARPDAATWLAVVAFIESSVFPIPPDLLLVPMILAARTRCWHLAAICTVASVAGGLAGYGLGYFLFDQIGAPVLDLYGYGDKFDGFRTYYNQWGAWAVLIAGMTPFPYKVITILSGVTALDPVVFTVASVIARGLRFFLIAALLWHFGPAIRMFIERRLGWVLSASLVLLVGGFVAIKWLP